MYLVATGYQKRCCNYSRLQSTFHVATENRLSKTDHFLVVVVAAAVVVVAAAPMDLFLRKIEEDPM